VYFFVLELEFKSSRSRLGQTAFRPPTDQDQLIQLRLSVDKVGLGSLLSNSIFLFVTFIFTLHQKKPQTLPTQNPKPGS
jgi:hypothetical protein